MEMDLWRIGGCSGYISIILGAYLQFVASHIDLVRY